MKKKPCTCKNHRKAAITRAENHVYMLETHCVNAFQYGSEIRWRWVCNCGKEGAWTEKSENLPYHRWLIHIEKYRWK